jgi:hypothetical protein
MQARAEAKAQTESNVVQLPLWQEFQRAAPACVLRSALFGVVKRGRRGYLKDKVLAAWGDDHIAFRGERLDQADLDVWLEMLHICRTTPLGETVEFEKYPMLKQLGRSTGKNDWKWLESSIKRMIACCVEVKAGSKRYLGSLIERGYINDETGRYVIILNRDMVTLFNAGFTLQHAEKRKLLHSDLSKWLAGYVESHKSPHKIAVKSLYNLCGTETKQLRDFRAKLKKAADALREHGIIKSWMITGNDVFQIIK